MFENLHRVAALLMYTIIYNFQLVNNNDNSMSVLYVYIMNYACQLDIIMNSSINILYELSLYKYKYILKIYFESLTNNKLILSEAR